MSSHITTLHEGKRFSESSGQPVRGQSQFHFTQGIYLTSTIGFTVASGFICMPVVSTGHLIQMRNILICQCGRGAQTQADGMSRPFIGVSIWQVTLFSTLPPCIKLLISRAVIDRECLSVWSPSSVTCEESSACLSNSCDQNHPSMKANNWMVFIIRRTDQCRMT